MEGGQLGGGEGVGGTRSGELCHPPTEGLGVLFSALGCQVPFRPLKFTGYSLQGSKR